MPNNSYDDAALAAVQSPTSAPAAAPVAPKAPMSYDDAAALAVGTPGANTIAAVKNNIYNAVKTSPDTAAANLNLARQANLPPESVAANPVPVQQQVAAQNTDVSSLPPATTQFLTNPQNAAIAHDDIQNLTAVEKGLAASPFDHYVQLAGQTAVKAGSFMNPYTAIPQILFDIPKQGLDIAIPQLLAAHPERSNALAEYLPKNQAFQDFMMAHPTMPVSAGGMVDWVANKLFPGGAPETKGEALASAGGTMAGVGSLMSAGSTLGKVWNTMTMATAGVAGAELQGKAEEWAKQNYPDNPFVQWAISQGAGLATLIGVGAAGHSLTGAVDNVAQGYAGKVAEASNGLAVADHMMKVNDLIAASKVRERDPASFESFIKSATEDTPIQDVYINAKQFAQAAGDDLPGVLQSVPSVGEQLATAMATDGDIRIPVEDFASKIAGTDLAPKLIPHLKTDPEGFSQTEAKDYIANFGEQMKADMTKELAAKTDDAQFQSSMSNVQTKLEDQLTSINRFTPDVNKPYAQLISNFYGTLAARTGETPEAMFEKYPLNLRAEGAGGGFDQAVYHGSPHRFDKFDMSKIGTGEGAQMYGHGIYFAENKDVAKTYSPRDTKLEEKLHKLYEKAQATDNYTRMEVIEQAMLNDTPEELLERFSGEDYTDEHAKEAVDIGKFIKKNSTKGQLYKIDIPDEDIARMIDWEKSWKDQTPEVQAALEQAAKNDPRIAEDLDIFKTSKPDTFGASGAFFYNGLTKSLTGDMKQLEAERDALFDKYQKKGMTQSDAVKSMSAKDGARFKEIADAIASHNPKAVASQFLADNGLAGIKYQDQGSRGTESGTRNFVVFDQKVLDKVNEKIGTLYQGLNQKQLGSYNPATMTMSIMKGADLSTVLHESGHFFLHVLTDIAGRDGAPDAVKADAQTLMDWFGVKDVDTFNKMTTDEQRVYHEQFARSFESYLMDGKAPSLELQPIFARFRSWLLNVYKSAADFLTANPNAGHITEDVRGVFDRLLATDDQIAKAQQARGMSPLFSSAAEANMNEKEFNSYVEQNQQATASATSEVDARRIRDMRFASGARDAAIKDLQRQAAGKRSEIRAEVTKEVQAEPVYAAEQYIKKGETFDGEKALGDVKMSTEGLKEIGIPDEMIAKMKQQKFASDGGTHPDTLAEMFGFNSGKELFEALSSAEPMAEKIKGLTDQRMLERHGDLIDPKSIADAADRAIFNDVRAKVVATELDALNKQLGNKTLLTKVAKDFAAEIVAKLPADKINPNQYIAAATKAAKAADKAFKAGDLKEAAAQKKSQLVNQYAVKAAFEAKTAVDKGLTFIKKLDTNKGYRAKIPGDYLEQIDALLNKYDFRKNPNAQPGRDAINLQKWVGSMQEAGFNPHVADFLINDPPMHYGDMSVEKFKGLVDALRSMKFMADNLKEVRLAGQKMALDEAVRQLKEPMLERGDKFTREELLNPPRKDIDPKLDVMMHNMGVALRLANADLRPQDYNWDIFDMHKINGPFRRLIGDPLFSANYWKLDQLRRISKEAETMGQQLGSEWRKSLLTFVDNKTLIDPDLGAPMKLTRGDMLGIARHVGNESNFDKLTKGWGWDGATVMKFLNDNMTEKDWQATAFEWKQAEHYWPQIEAQARRLGGVPPEKIPLRPFDTKFGRMEGGYSPISYHPERSKLVDRFNDFTVGNSGRIGEEQPYRAATTFNGSTQNRASGYTDKVDLGFHSFEVRLRDTVHDLAYHEVLLDLSKITNHPEFREQFQKTFGKEQYGALKTFLTGVRDMNLDDNPNKTFERWVQYSRKGMVMTATGYRISTILKHVGSEALKTFGYLGDGAGAKYFAARVARMATGNAGEDIAGAMQKFPEIAARSMQFDRDYREGMKSLYHDESVMAKNERFGHAFIATMDKWISVPTAWAAYDRAVSEGIPKELGGTGEPMSEQDAVNYANKIVRESHGTATEVSRSNFMQSRGAKSLLATIYQFGNNTKGQLDAHLDQLLTGTRNKAQVFGSSMAVFLAPALMAGWVAGDFDDKTPWWKSVGQAVTGEIAGTVPLVREIAAAIVRQEPDKIMEIPALKPVADAVRAMVDAYKEAGGHSTRIIKDAMNAIGELFHIAGLGQAATSIQYLKDVQDGKQDPKNAKDFITGATIGPPPKH